LAAERPEQPERLDNTSKNCRTPNPMGNFAFFSMKNVAIQEVCRSVTSVSQVRGAYDILSAS
jgi:hypothetical protein